MLYFRSNNKRHSSGNNNKRHSSGTRSTGMGRLNYLHANVYGQYVGEQDTFSMAEKQYTEQEREHARLVAQAQRDLREISERCFEYGDFDEE